jgi:hypothetical protein
MPMHEHSYKLQEVVIMTNDYLHIASEINTLTDLLADIPADNLIERMSLIARLNNAKAALDSVPMQPNKVRLTFRGKPVVRNQRNPTHGQDV